MTNSDPHLSADICDEPESRKWAFLLTLRDVMRTAYSRGEDRLMSVWQRDITAIDWAVHEIERLRKLCEMRVDHAERLIGGVYVIPDDAQPQQEPVGYQFRQRSGVGKGPQSSAPWGDWCAIDQWFYQHHIDNPSKIVEVRALYAAQPLAAPAETCKHEAIIGLDGKWHCQKCAAAIEMTPAQSDPVSPSSAATVQVRPLEWDEGKGELKGQLLWSSGDPWVFWIVKNPDSNYIWCENFNIDGFVPASPVRGSYDTLEEAKAAAQTDYDERIRAAVILNEPQPAPVPDLDTAWQWDGKELLHDTPDWVAENTEPTWSSLSLAGFTGGITAFTSFGKARLKKGDWLVRHEGEIHAVKDAVYSALSRPERS